MSLQILFGGQVENAKSLSELKANTHENMEILPYFLNYKYRRLAVCRSPFQLIIDKKNRSHASLCHTTLYYMVKWILWFEAEKYNGLKDKNGKIKQITKKILVYQKKLLPLWW